MPLIRLLAVLEPAQRAGVLRTLAQGNGDVGGEIASLFAQYDAVDYAQQRALEYLQLAKDALEEAAASGPIEELRQLADFVAVRQQ